MKVIRFPFERRRYGWLVITKRLQFRFYPPSLPKFTWWKIREIGGRK